VGCGTRLLTICASLGEILGRESRESSVKVGSDATDAHEDLSSLNGPGGEHSQSPENACMPGVLSKEGWVSLSVYLRIRFIIH
jgi:hypothetical protein